MPIAIHQSRLNESSTYHRPFTPELLKHIGKLARKETPSRVLAQEMRPVTRQPNQGVPKYAVGGLEQANPYKQTPAQTKQSFLSVFSGQMLGSGYARKVPPFYYGLIVASYFKAFGVSGYTWLPVGKTAPRLPKELRKTNRESLDKFRKTRALRHLVKVRKTPDYFEIEAPLSHISDGKHLRDLVILMTSYQRGYLNSLQTNEPVESLPGFSLVNTIATPSPEAESDGFQSPSGAIDMGRGLTELEVIQRLSAARYRVEDLSSYIGGPIPLNALQHFDKYLQHLSFRKMGGDSTLVMMGSFHVPAADIQALTSTQYNLVNPHDVCGLFETWVGASVGYARKEVPQFILPLPRVRATLPSEGIRDYRINDSGLTVTAAGRFLWLPREVDTIDTYESQSQEFYRNEDGSYSSAAVDGTPKNKSRAIPPRVVYIDWVNKKLAYTNRLGDLEITALDRCQPATRTHYARFFQKTISNLSLILNYTFSALQVVVPSAFARIGSINVDSFLGSFIDAAQQAYGPEMVYDQLELSSIIEAVYESSDFDRASGTNPSIAKWEAFADACKEMFSVLERDPLMINDRFAVPIVLEIRAAAFLIGRYKTAVDLNQLQEEDRQARSKYLNQGLDPDYQVKALPFVKDDPEAPMKLLPHQVKLENFMRDSPDFALWGVDAGGGKTPISVMNYLKEMAEGNVKRILVLVPKNLVSTHINDITDFTNGRMNIIPVTTYTKKRHGLGALKDMIDRSPINTVVIASTTTLSDRHVVAYGSSTVEVYPVAEWLRQFNWDYVVIDEIHELRNETARQRAVMRTIQGVKKIRGMSGTLVANQPQDLAPQMALFDPTIFGNQEEFKRTYAEEMTGGGKVLRWKEGFEQEINQKIKDNSVFVQILRKEWAALLPELHQALYECHFTSTQRQVYLSILQGAKNEAMQDSTIRKLLEQIEEERGQDANPEDIEEKEAMIMERLQDALRPYIARLERYVSAPYVEDAGKGLEGVDRISPKLVKAGEICLSHLQQGIPGKIIIFTNYVWVAEDGFNYLNSVPGLQGKVLHYYAGDAENLRAQFLNRDDIRIMIGQSSSMDTGLNMQHASRLIRLDSVWTPGKYEQGNSRINRLNMGNQGETRKSIYIDTLFVNDTIDVTKSCYLMAKIITAEKFKNAGNPKYDNIKTPDLFRMTMDNIFSMSNTEDLQEWIGPFRELDQAQRDEVAEYRRENPSISLAQVPRAPNVEGAALMHRTPYDPGTLLYSEDDLGLVRYDHFSGSADEDVDEEEDDAKEDESTREQSRIETEKMRGLAVHTDQGDGEIHSVSKKRIAVRLYSTGTLVSVSKLATFVITRSNTNSRDMRLLLAQKNADLPLEIRKEDLVPPKEKPRRGRVKPEKPVVEEILPEVELEFITINGMLVVQAVAEDETRSAMRQFGFETPPDIVFAKIRSWRQFQSLAFAWAGIDPSVANKDPSEWPKAKDPFRMSKDSSNELKVMFDYLRMYGVRGTDLFDITRKNDFRMFKLKTIKPNPDRRMIHPFPFVYNDSFHVGLPLRGHAGTNQAILRSKRAVSPTPKWQTLPKTVLWKYLGSKSQVHGMLRDIAAAGIEITNLDDLKIEFRSLRVKKTQV